MTDEEKKDQQWWDLIASGLKAAKISGQIIYAEDYPEYQNWPVGRAWLARLWKQVKDQQKLEAKLKVENKRRSAP